MTGITQAAAKRLSFQIHQLLENFIRCGDHAGIGLESPLSGDHIDKTLSKIDVREFQRVGQDAAESGAVRRTGDRLTRVSGLRKRVFTCPGQTDRIRESGKDYLRQGAQLSVGEPAADHPVRIHTKGLQRAGRVAVLGLLYQSRGRAELRGSREPVPAVRDDAVAEIEIDQLILRRTDEVDL